MNIDLFAITGLQSIDELYVLVEWPFVQGLMEYEWFRQECFLYSALHDQVYLDSAYFVPLTRLMAITRPG